MPPAKKNNIALDYKDCKHRLECKVKGSNKFYEIFLVPISGKSANSISGWTIITRHGPIGSIGIIQNKGDFTSAVYGTSGAASAYANQPISSIVTGKLSKGYKEVKFPSSGSINIKKESIAKTKEKPPVKPKVIDNASIRFSNIEC